MTNALSTLLASPSLNPVRRGESLVAKKSVRAAGDAAQNTGDFKAELAKFDAKDAPSDPSVSSRSPQDRSPATNPEVEADRPTSPPAEAETSAAPSAPTGTIKVEQAEPRGDDIASAEVEVPISNDDLVVSAPQAQVPTRPAAEAAPAAISDAGAPAAPAATASATVPAAPVAEDSGPSDLPPQAPVATSNRPATAPKPQPEPDARLQPTTPEAQLADVTSAAHVAVAVRPMTIRMLNALLAQGEKGKLALGVELNQPTPANASRASENAATPGTADAFVSPWNQPLAFNAVSDGAVPLAGVSDPGRPLDSTPTAPEPQATQSNESTSRATTASTATSASIAAAPVVSSTRAAPPISERLGWAKLEPTTLSIAPIGGPTARERSTISSAPADAQGPERFRAAMLNQVQRGLAAAMTQARAPDGQGTVTLRLQPESLGALRVRVELTDVSIGVRFEAGSDTARDLLRAALPTLRSTLESKGLAVDRLSVESLTRGTDAAKSAESPAHGSRETQTPTGMEARFEHAMDGGLNRDGRSSPQDPGWNPGQAEGLQSEAADSEVILGPERSRIDVLDLVRLRVDATA